MKKTFLLPAAVLMALALPVAAQTPATPKHHVVFQVTEPEGTAWESVIPHVQNLLAAFEKDGGAEVEVVFFGQGLNMLRKTDAAYADGLKELADKGVKIAACQNAMRFLKLKTEDLFPFAMQVDAGVAELTRKQEAGWAYIH